MTTKNIPQIWEGTLTLLSRASVARDTVLFQFEVTTLRAFRSEAFLAPASFTFTPGQFVSLQFGPKAWRAYSIASAPNGAQFDLLVRLIPGGVGSEVLRVMKNGHSLPFRGPVGKFVLPDQVTHPTVLCATGTGIAPFRSMVLARKNTENIHVWYGGRNPEDIAEVELLRQHLGDRLRVTYSRLDTAPDGADLGRIIQYIPHRPENGRFFLCGNGDMVQDMESQLKDAGVSPEHIHTERYN